MQGNVNAGPSTTSRMKRLSDAAPIAPTTITMFTAPRSHFLVSTRIHSKRQSSTPKAVPFREPLVSQVSEYVSATRYRA
jgi:hypothetical protein